MTTLFPYPQGLMNRNNRHIRHLLPPSVVGPLPNSKEHKLFVILESHLERFSKTRTLTSKGSITINLSRDGTRKVFTGRRVLSTSIFPSRKTGTSIVCEGPNELLFAQESEIDAGITDYATQAVKFKIAVDGKLLEYYCDYCRRRADDRIEIVEVKPNSSHFEEPGYKAKMEAVAELCRLLGWQFRRVFGTDLQQKTFHNFHTSWIYGYRFYKFNELSLQAISKIAKPNSGALTVGQLIDACANLVEARATISALICLGEIHLDLTKPVYCDTVVTVIKGGQL
jgi:hypothetical protein